MFSYSSRFISQTVGFSGASASGWLGLFKEKVSHDLAFSDGA